MVRLKETGLQGEQGIQGFQFLMVRLKALPIKKPLVQKSISIPYGSIKSFAH